MDAAGSDYSKSGILPPTHQRLRQDVLRDTTRAMATAKLVPDAVVIAGDVTYQDKKDGWEHLPGILEPLREVGLSNDHVVITPGNHDVTKNLPVDDDRHYGQYLGAIHDEWVSPMLDARDIDEHGHPTVMERKYLLLPEQLLAIVPINSSHYCGVREPFDWLPTDEHNEVIKILGDAGRAPLVEAFNTLRQRVEKFGERDPVRISPNQICALGELSSHIDETATLQGISPSELTRIAVMHHPTLPATVSEEFKPFESLSNLALVRLFLAGSGFHILLHGHKHAGTVYTDHIARFGQEPDRPEHRLLVVSGSTLSGEQGQTQAATLLNIDTRPLRRAVTLTFIPPAALPPSLPKRLPSATYRLWEEDMRATAPLVLSGQTVAETYERVLAAFSDEGTIRRNLMCTVERPDNAELLPPDYPTDIPGNTPEGRQKWFSDTVNWWQRPNSKLLETLHFTHGERLKSYRSTGKPLNQIDEAVAVLQGEDTSTRAVLTLTDPARDKIATKRGFPSCVMLHAMLRRDSNGVALDVLGVFRKQEMRYWWPINVAEMATVQDELLEALNQPDVRPGRLVTLASFAHAGTEVPAVNIALIDRLADEDPQSSKIWTMAYYVAHPEDSSEAAELWESVLEDLTPSAASTRVTSSVIGLQELLGWLERLSRDPVVEPVKVAVRALHETLNKVADDDLDDFWRNELIDRVNAVRDALSVRSTSHTATIDSESQSATDQHATASAAVETPKDPT
jgi:hypothetical protein